MSIGDVKARARVLVTVELDVGSWGSDCTAGQIHKQAADSALRSLGNKLAPGMRITGKPVVEAVYTTEKRA